MMQAAGNPLLSLMGGAPASAAAPQSVGEGKSASGFAALFAGVQAPQSAPANGGEGRGNPLVGLLKQVLPALEQLKGAVSEAEGLPEGVVEDVLGKLDQLTAVLSDLADGKPVDTDLLADKLADILPQDVLDGLAIDQATPLLVVQALQQATLSIVSDLSAIEGSVEMPQPLNLGAVVRVIAKLQASVAPPAPGQHPVAIASRLGLQETEANPTTIEISAEVLEGDAANLAPAGLFAGRSAGNGNAAQAVGDFLQQVAASPAHAAGLIEIPSDMVQVIPEEVASALQTVSETQAQSAQVQQAGRADAPQAKFTQAVIGQLRSVDFQEGTTKVELNPRGLGSVEIEMRTNIDGSLSVVVRAESAHVLSSLREESDLLGQIVGQGGEASVDFQEFDSGDQQSFEDQAGLTRGESAADAIDETGADQTERATIGNGQLDLMT